MRFGLLGVLFILSSLGVNGQEIRTAPSFWENYTIHNYGVDDGISSQQVYDIRDDERGFVWLVSNRQLLRFDGLGIKELSKGNEGGTLYQMAETTDGNKWLPSIGSGLYKFEGDSLQSLAELSGDLVKSIAVASDTLFIGMYGEGLKIIHKDSVIASYTTEDGLVGNEIWTLDFDDNNQLWIGTNTGLSILTNGTFSNFTTENGLPYNNIRSIEFLENGEVWIGTDNEGIVIFENNLPVRYLNISDGLPSAIVNAIHETKDGQLLIGTLGGGLTSYQNGRFETLTLDDGLVSNNINTVHINDQGVIFVGTEDGLSLLVPKLFQTLSIDGQKPFLEEAVTLNQDGDGKIWLGTYGLGYRYLDGNTWKSIENPPNVTNGYAQSGTVDAEGNLWVGTQGSGVFKIEGATIIPKLTTSNGLKDDYVRGLTFDKNGHLWVGSNKGISVFDSDLKLLKTFAEENEIPNPFCITMMTSSDGSIWYGSYGGGVVQFTNDLKRIFDTKKGLRSDQVLSIFEDSNNDIWISTFNYGISRVDGDSLITFGPESGLPEGINIAGMAEDENENLWLASGNGVLRIALEEFEKFENGVTERLTYKYYNRDDGLISDNLQAANNSTVLKIPDGDILFASIDGVSFIDPSTVPDRNIHSGTYIDEIIIEGEPTELLEKIILTPEEKRLEISYSAINFLAPDKTRFRVMLSGINEDWEYVENRTSAYYDYLPEGDYTFTVSATGPDGQWSEKTASLTFTVLPPFYKTWWFRFAILIGFTGMVAGFVQWQNNARVKALNRELAYQQKIHKERERISRDLHDNVGSQISNLITGIEIGNLHVQKNQKDEAVKIFSTLDSDARSAMSDLRETIWLMDKDEIEFSKFFEHIKDYVRKQSPYLKNMKVEVNSDINKSFMLKPTLSLNTMRIIQEALNNAKKYSKADCMEIKFDLKNNGLMIEIKDSGIGFDVEKSVSKGYGLTNMKNRAESMNADFNVESSPNQQTRLTLFIPDIP